MKNNKVKLLYIFFALLVVILSLYNINTVARQMSDENIYADRDGRVVFIHIVPGGVSDKAGLQVGDILLEINDEPVSSAGHAQKYLDRANLGESLEYTIERNGQIFDIKVDLALAGLRIWHVGAVFTGILFLIFGLFLALSRPDYKYARLMATTALLLALMTVNLQFVLQKVQFNLIYQLTVYFIYLSFFWGIAVIAHASLYFPEKKFEKIKSIWMIKGHYVIAGLMAIFASFEFFNRGAVIRLLFLPQLIYILIIEVTFWRRRRKEYKARTKFFKATIAILIFTSISGYYLATRTAYSEYLAFSMILVPISYFYTTVKYRVFDIQLRWRLSLIYNLLQIVLYIGFFLAIIFIVRYLPLWKINLPAVFLSGNFIEFYNINSLPPDLQNQVQIGYQILIGIILTFIGFVLKNYIKKLLDRLFFQQKYDYKIALKNFSEMLSSSLTREDLSRVSVDQIYRVMKLKGTMIAIPENGYFRISNSVGTLQDLNMKSFELPHHLISQLSQLKEHIKTDQLANIPLLKTKSDNIMCGMPITSADKRLEAILFAGEKLSESPYNNEDVELLNYFSDHLGTAFERARLYEEMADRERIKRELEIAREIQINSLPKCEPDYSGLQICASLSPAYEVGGDYYDYIEIDENRLAILVGDVLGKGASAAFHMSKIQGFVQSLSTQITNPPELLEKLNSLIEKNFDSEFFFTALYGVFDTKNRTLDIYRLGHNGLIYFNNKQKSTSVIEPPGIGLGLTDCQKFRESLKHERINYQTGDVFAFLTDGYMESMNSEQQTFGEDRIWRLIQDHNGQSASEIMEALSQAINHFSNNILYDDKTGIIVKILD